MRFGCFGSSQQLADIAAAGYDCAELDFCEITDMDEIRFNTFCREAKASGLGFEVFSGLLPLTERFHSPEFNLNYWLDHTAKGAARVRELGCTIIPFGAGKCRSIPENADRKTAEKTVSSIVRAFASVLDTYDIQLVVEPLGPPNSNYLNTLAETNTFLKEVDHPNCLAMCDLRHMHKSGEPLSEIETYYPIIKHAHIDYPRKLTRYFPAPEDDFDYLPYFQELNKVQYSGILTVEATAVKKNFSEEAAICNRFLKLLEEKAR